MRKYCGIINELIKFAFKFVIDYCLNRIKEILKIQGRSQIWLAEQIGKSYVIVTNYCNNKSQPSIPTLKRIAKILDVDIRELLEPTKDSQD